MTSYTDAEGNTATYTYDGDGRTSSVADSKGSQS
jgi:YD repeat-containing protein